MDGIEVKVVGPSDEWLGELTMGCKKGQLYPANIYMVMPDGTKVRYSMGAPDGDTRK